MSSPDKIKSIVLTCDRYRAITEHMIFQYDRLWPDHPFVFHVPYQELGGVDTERVKYLTAPSDIKGTVLHLLTEIDDERQARELAEWKRTLEQRVAEQVGQVERLGRLKRFFSPQLAELSVAGGATDPLKSHRVEVTVVFLDLRGFTAFAETADPEEVMGVLREYHAEMERFTGDGMMVFFNDPVPVANAPELAIRMALAMRGRAQQLDVGWRKRGHDLGMGIGIAQGYATIGAIGFEGRLDYGAIGTVTNLAARLCGEASATEILVSQRVAGAVEHLVSMETLGPLTLKGFARPVPAFRLLGWRRQ